MGHATEDGISLAKATVESGRFLWFGFWIITASDYLGLYSLAGRRGAVRLGL